MKKRIVSLVTALMMIAGLCIPASAAGIRTEMLELIPVDDVESSPTVTVIDGDISAEGTMQIEAGLPQEGEDTDSTVYAIRNNALPQEVHIYPIVMNTQTGEGFIINNVQRSMSWSPSSQFKTFYLSPSQVNAFLADITNALANDPNTSSSTWAIVGWYLNAIIYLTAEMPRRVEFEQSFLKSGTEYTSKKLYS